MNSPTTKTLTAAEAARNDFCDAFPAGRHTLDGASAAARLNVTDAAWVKDYDAAILALCRKHN